MTITGAGVAGYNGSWTITAVPTPRQFKFTNPTAGLANSGAGTMNVHDRPFKVQPPEFARPAVESVNIGTASGVGTLVIVQVPL